MDRLRTSKVRAFGIARDWKASALEAEEWVETVGAWVKAYGPMEERKGRRG